MVFYKFLLHIPAKQCTRTFVNLILFSMNSIAFSKYFDKS